MTEPKQPKPLKMTRAEAQAIAAAARKLPEGVVSVRGQLHLSAELAVLFEGMTPGERGKMFEAGVREWAIWWADPEQNCEVRCSGC